MELPVQKVKEILNLSDNIVPLGMIHIGYPDEEKDARTKYNEDYVHFI